MHDPAHGPIRGESQVLLDESCVELQECYTSFMTFTHTELNCGIKQQRLSPFFFTLCEI